ncbi:hypothetical protein GQ457_15G010560 [Hibiscus cannabinus]
MVTLGWNQGVDYLIVQLNNVEAYCLLSPPPAMNPFALVRSIATILARAWMVKFTLVRHEANMTADMMAKLGTPSDGSLQIFMAPHQRSLIYYSEIILDPYHRIRGA